MPVPDSLFCLSRRVKTVTKGPRTLTPNASEDAALAAVDGCSAAACRQRAGQSNSTAGAMIKLMA